MIKVKILESFTDNNLFVDKTEYMWLKNKIVTKQLVGD
jgi:hypothetical protein